MWWWCGIIAVLVVAGCGGGSSDEPVPADSREGSTQVPAPAKEPRAVKSAWGEGQKLGAIFDDAPQEARPRDDQDAVRIKRLNEWLVKQDLASKTVSVTLPEAQMAMFEMDGGFRISYFHRPVNIDVHGVDFVLVLGVPAGIRLVNVDTDTADKLYEYKGKDTRITGKVERLFFNGRMLTLTFTELRVGDVDVSAFMESRHFRGLRRVIGAPVAPGVPGAPGSPKVEGD